MGMWPKKDGNIRRNSKHNGASTPGSGGTELSATAALWRDSIVSEHKPYLQGEGNSAFETCW